MDKVIIVTGIICTIYLFYNLIRIRINSEKNRQNRVYASIVIIFVLMFIWNIFRQWKNLW